MANPELKRDYRMTDGELSTFVSNFCSIATRDLLDLTSFGLTEAKITALDAKCNDFEMFPSDEYLAGLQTLATETKNNKYKELKDVMAQMAWRVETKWGANSKQYKMLDIVGIHNQPEDTVLRLARSMYLSMTHFLPDLADTGLTQAMLDDFLDLCDGFETAKKAKHDAMVERDDKAQERVELGNMLYREVTSLAEIGKKLYANVDPAKYNDYIIYQKEAGGLSVPANFRYDFIGKTFWWDVVNHATSYQLEKKEGEGYTEIYSGSDTSFHYVPADGQGFYRVRARNMNGFGPATEDLEQWYFAVLPPATNLQISDTEIEPGKYNLTWTAVPTATEYSVYRSVVENGQPAGDFSLQGKTAEASFVISVESGKRNYFRVNTKNLSQYAVPSEPVWIEV